MKYGLGLVAIAAALGPASLLSAGYSFTMVAEGEMLGINPSGTAMVGETRNGDGLVWNAGSISTLTVPGARTTFCGVNDSGTIAALHEPLDTQPGRGGFITHVANLQFTPGSLADLDEVTGINNAGDMVGWGAGGMVLRHADGDLESVVPPVEWGGVAVPSGINSSGVVVGRLLFAPAGTHHGWIRSSTGQYTMVDVPGALSTDLSAINDLGQAVGSYQDASGMHGFIRSADGTIETVDGPATRSPFTRLDGISNNGTVVGVYIDDANTQWAFYATVPEPAALSAMGIGGVMLLRRRGR